MVDGGVFSEKLNAYCKHDGRQWTITAAGDEVFFAGLLKKAPKSIVLQQFVNAVNALHGKLIVVQHNGIVERKIVGKSIRI
ncbi:MAG: hypothetical protein D6714_08485 [Bacteroidetes bacterium]|nr:MAG: hypothetical protein D6714_08485 [Bacteroidota bacterium]